MADDLAHLCGHLAGLVRFDESLAQFSGIGRGLGIVRDDKVDLALNRCLEIGTADLCQAVLALVGEQYRLGVRRVCLEPAQNADRVARRSEGEFADDGDEVHIRKQLREVDQHVARQIDHRHFEGLPEFLFQLHETRAVGHQRRIDRRFRRQNGQIVVRTDHRAFDEQAVDPTGIVDRVGQPAPRLEVKREGAGAEVHIEIEHRGRQLVLVAEQPCERGRDG